MPIRLTSNGNPWVREHPTFQDMNDTQNYLEQQDIGMSELAVRILQSNNSYINGPNIVVDNFTNSNGIKNTIGSTTCEYDSDNDYYRLTTENDDPSLDTNSNSLTFTNINNAYDEDDGTASTLSTTRSSPDSTRFGKIFSVARHIANIRIKATCFRDRSPGGFIYTNTIKLYTYNGSTWDLVTTLASGSSGTTSNVSYDGTYFLDSSVEGVAVYFEGTADGNHSVDYSVFSLEYGDFSSSGNVVCDSNTTTLDGNETGFAVSVPDASIPTNTSISVVISDGSNSLASAIIDSVSKGVFIGNPGTLTSGTLQATFTLATSDTSVTPTISNYGIKITR